MLDTHTLVTFSVKYPMVKLFAVEDMLFAYDSKANLLIEMLEEDIVSLSSLGQDLSLGSKDESNLSEILKRGVFIPGFVDKVVPNDDEILGIICGQFDSVIPRKFVLEITEDCTLRCKYCAYSNEEANRKHSSAIMSEDTAYKAIDYYFRKYTAAISKVSIEKRDRVCKIAAPNLSWWGGEPFTNFQLIAKTKKYFESLPWYEYGIKQEQLMYSVVTNFTILTDEIVNFLVDNNIFVFVSLDGGQVENDTNRVFVDGRGSFNKVVGNIDRMLNDYPEYCKKNMIVQSVLADNTDHSSCQRFIRQKFFSENEPLVLKKSFYPQKNKREFPPKNLRLQEDYEVRIISGYEQKLLMLNEVDKETLFALLRSNTSLVEEFEDLFSLEASLSFDNPKGGNYHSRKFSCPAGIDNTFVACNGDIHICNKTDNSFSFGNVFHGVSKDALKIFYSKYYSGLRNKCSKCWAFQYCEICPAHLLDEGDFYYPNKEGCAQLKEKVSIKFQKYILLAMHDSLYENLKSFCFDNKEISFLNYKGAVFIE